VVTIRMASMLMCVQRLVMQHTGMHWTLLIRRL
jgi:hypothetical protein